MDKEQIKFWTAVKEGAAEVKEAAVSSSQHVRADVADVLERTLTKGIDKVLLSADSELSAGPVGALDVTKICAALPVIIKGLEIASRLPLPKIAAAAAVAVETLTLAQDAFCGGGGGLFGAADPETQQAAQAVVDELLRCCEEC